MQKGEDSPLVQDQRTNKAFNLAPLISVSDYCTEAPNYQREERHLSLVICSAGGHCRYLSYIKCLESNWIYLMAPQFKNKFQV